MLVVFHDRKDRKRHGLAVGCALYFITFKLVFIISQVREAGGGCIFLTLRESDWGLNRRYEKGQQNTDSKKKNRCAIVWVLS